MGAHSEVHTVYWELAIVCTYYLQCRLADEKHVMRTSGLLARGDWKPGLVMSAWLWLLPEQALCTLTYDGDKISPHCDRVQFA